MVCTPDLYYQEFKVEGPELRRFKHEFLKRLDMYYDLVHDEKEKAKVQMNPEDFFNGSWDIRILFWWREIVHNLQRRAR